MKVKSLNSIVFHTENLDKLISFYSDILFLEPDEYVDNGNTVQDISNNHVNYVLDEMLLCFEAGKQTDQGTIILNVEDIKESKEILKNLEIKIEKDNKDWFTINDPDGRTIIFE